MTTGDQAIERFLEEKSEPGRFDSSGSFKMSGEEALRKLVEHSVSHPAYWILKVVQAAVAGDADGVRIRQFRRSTQADLLMDQLPRAEEFPGALLRLEAPLGSCLGELCIGLRALLKDHFLRILWCQDGTAQGFHWNGEALDPLEPAPIAEQHQALRIEVPAGLFSFGARAEEARLLRERCRWSPVPIVLDGRAINDRHPTPRSQFSKSKHATGSPRCLMGGWFDSAKGQRPRWAEPIHPEVNYQQDELRAKEPFLYWPAPENSSQLGGFCLYLSYEYRGNAIGDLISYAGRRHSTLLNEAFHLGATRLGVLCAAYRSDDFGLGGEVIIPGDDFSTDLVGLSVSLSEEWFQEMRRILEALHPRVTSTQQRLEAYRPKMTVKDGAEFARNLTLGVTAGAITAVVGLASGGVVSLAAPFVPLYFAWLTDLDDPTLLAKLPAWLHENYVRLKANPPPRYWHLVDLDRQGA